MIVEQHNFLEVISDGLITGGSNMIEEIEVVSRGVKVGAVSLLGKELQWEAGSIAWAIGTTPRTLERHKKDNKRLSVSISENALELAKLSTLGLEYFGDVKRWNEWLNMPNVQFNNQTPKSFMNTILGRELIKRVILSLDYGFTS